MDNGSTLPPERSFCRPPATAGFTLVEILVVMFIVSLMIGLSGVYLGTGLGSAKLSTAGRDLSATIRYARALARTTGTTQAVEIDLDGKRYGIEGKGFKEIPPEVHVKVVDPLQGEISRGKYSVNVHPLGGVEGGTVVLSRDRRRLSLEMDPIVGSVTIKE